LIARLRCPKIKTRTSPGRRNEVGPHCVPFQVDLYRAYSNDRQGHPGVPVQGPVYPIQVLMRDIPNSSVARVQVKV